MPIQSVPLGPATTLLAGVAYALPGVKATIFSDSAATFTQSNTLAFTASSPVTLTGGSAVVSAAFIKASADALVTLKRD